MDRIAKETGGAHIDTEATDPQTYFQHSANLPKTRGRRQPLVRLGGIRKKG